MYTSQTFSHHLQYVITTTTTNVRIIAVADPQEGGWGDASPPTGVFKFFDSQPDASYLLIATAVSHN